MTEIKEKYPLIIIGAGPAGLTASIYASRYKIENLIIGQSIGGLIFDSHKVCNFPTEKEISGKELVEKMKNHAQFLGAPVLQDKVALIKEEGELFSVSTQLGKTILGEAIIMAIGTEYRKLNLKGEEKIGLKGEEKFIGRGVSYCATCDGMFYKDKVVAVIGGSDSANVSSLYLADIAKKVYQIYRRDKLRGETAWIDQILENKKIEVIYNTQLVGLKGEEKLEKIVLDKPYHKRTEIPVDGLFIEIGTEPKSNLINELELETTKNGYIKVNPDQSTSRERIWAAGDITDSSNGFRQVVTAVSEGAIAADSAFKFFQKRNKK